MTASTFSVLRIPLFLLGIACHKEQTMERDFTIDGKTQVQKDSKVKITPKGSSYIDHAFQAMQESPEAVIQLFMTWDTAGKRNAHGLDSGYDTAYAAVVCWLPEEQCTTDEPGYDVVEIVTGYTTRLIEQNEDTAHVQVVANAVAEVVDGRVIPKQSTLEWTFYLQKLSGEWRIVRPESQKPPWVSLQTARRIYALTSSDSSVLSHIKQ